jgi:thiol-disulfide isomerase/thioredoxin
MKKGYTIVTLQNINLDYEMKRPQKALLIALGTIILGSGIKAATLKGTISPAPESKKLYLYIHQGDQVIVVDSTSHKGGKFLIKSKEKNFPRGVYKLGVNPQNSTSLILSNEDILMECNAKNWEQAAISNSKENALFTQFKDLNKRFSFEMEVLEIKYRNLIPKAQTDKAAFDTGLTQLRSKADSLMKDKELQYLSWKTENLDLYFSKMIRLLSADPAESPETYITAADFEDLENLRANVWETRITNLIQKFGQQDPEKWVILGDQVINLSQPGTIARQIALRAVAKCLQPLEQNGLNAGYDVAKRYTQEFPGIAAAEFLKGFNPGPPAVGELAPDIELNDREGNPMKLSSLRGKVVLIDFWASWCGPCRHENPTVVKAFQKYEPKGFTVFSVSLDQSKDKWLAAIVKDGLIWNNHVSDLKGWQSAGSALYKVSSIPATFLIDQSGKIIAKNLRGPALEDKLRELLGP